MTARETVARAWHEGSDHAKDGCPFGGPLCNCDQVAGRMLPMLRKAYDEGWFSAVGSAPGGVWFDAWADGPKQDNPYEAKEDQMGQKCSFCEETTDDLTTGGGGAACRDCMAKEDRHVDQ